MESLIETFLLQQYVSVVLTIRRAKTAVKKPLVLTLSKQTRLICPQILILCGLMQKMPMFLRRRWAYTMPAVIAAGSAGGTVMVMMSRDSMMMVLAGTWVRQKGKSQEIFACLINTCLWLPTTSSYKSALLKLVGIHSSITLICWRGSRFKSQICGIFQHKLPRATFELNSVWGMFLHWLFMLTTKPKQWPKMTDFEWLIL